MMPPHVTPEAIYRVLDERMAQLTNMTACLSDEAAHRDLQTAIRTLLWAKAELTVLIECPPVPLPSEKHGH